jgi:para-aminobenzoate synthetase/4-amino-4-deoxychorismate lyase
MAPWALLRSDAAGGAAARAAWWRFSRPLAVLRADRPDEVPGLLGELEAASRTGLWAVGFVAYQAAGAFDPALVTRGPGTEEGPGGPAGVPAAWFGLFGEPEALAAMPAAGARGPRAEPGDPRLRLLPSISDADYLRAVATVRAAIARGETYQANLTYRLRGPLPAASLTPFELFARLSAHQSSLYSAFLDLGDGEAAVCSVSPELFFRRDGRRLRCRPMKGTAPRGRSAEEDRRLAAALRSSAKERAENLMIVDMTRNDLGRIARPGSVRVRGLFEVERYATVHQMVSEVEAESDAPLADVFAALFPCASVTGAPKVRTMAILAELETTPRGLYTGAIGYLAPGGAARFGVAIRTAWVDRGTLEYGTGGGIVWDSEAARELAETRAKALVLVRALGGEPVAEPAFRLLETLLWCPATGFALLERHLARLASSAEQFGFPVDLGRVRGRLAELGASLGAGRQRVRLLVGPTGEVSLEHRALEPTRRPWVVVLAAEPVDRRDPYLRHKTTRREVYDRALERARERARRETPAPPPPDDVLLWNREGELTETTVANLVLRLDGRLVTPAAACGLLPGTIRAELLARGRIAERVVKVEELDRAEALYLINSLRGWIPARLAGKNAAAGRVGRGGARPQSLCRTSPSPPGGGRGPG